MKTNTFKHWLVILTFGYSALSPLAYGQAAAGGTTPPDYGQGKSMRAQWKEKNIPNEKDGHTYTGSHYYVECQMLAGKPWSEMIIKYSSTEDPEGWKGAWADLSNTYTEAVKDHKDELDTKTVVSAIKELVTPPERKPASAPAGQEVAAPVEPTGLSAVPPENMKKVKEKIAHIAHFYQNLVDAGQFYQQTLFGCEGLAAVTTHVNLTDPSEFAPTKGPPRQFAHDRSFFCHHTSAETQDYPACLDLINAYGGTTVAKQGMETGQSMDHQIYSSDAINKAQTADGASVPNALGYQKGSLERMQDYSNQRAALGTAAIATLNTILQKMPTRSSLESECIDKVFTGKPINENLKKWKPFITSKVNEFNTELNQAFMEVLGANITQQDQVMIDQMSLKIETSKDQDTQHHFSYRMTEFKNEIAAAPSAEKNEYKVVIPDNVEEGKEIVNKEGLCNHVIARDASELIQNDQARTAVNQILQKEGVDVLGNLAKAMNFGNQADKIDDALGQLQQFQPQPFPTPVIPDAPETASTDQLPECIANPQSENCIGKTDNTQSVGFGGGFQFGEVGSPGKASTYSNVAGTGLGDSGAAATGVGGASPMKFGDPLATVGGKSDNAFESMPAGDAGSPGTAKPNYGGGGGGGSGGGLGGGGGGGSGAAGGGGAGENYRKSAVAYGDNGKGGLSFSGGGGKGAKKADGSNPFDKLINKGANGEVLGYRGPASEIGDKKASIFGMISGAYQRAVDKKNLLEYEKK